MREVTSALREAAPPPTSRGSLHGVVRWLPGLAVLVVALWVPWSTGVAPLHLLGYGAYWLLGVLTPGVLVHRALRGPRPVLVEELGLGAATGLALEICAGLLLGYLGWDSLARWWWVPAYVLFLLLPRLRWAWRRPEIREPQSAGWALTMAAIAVAALMTLVPSMAAAPLPPQDGSVYQDLWWHMSLNEEMLKPGPAEIPQVSGEPLQYHWFANLHMAIAAESSGVPAPMVLLRLWFVPIILATVALIATLARTTTRQGWTGPLAVWLSVFAVAGGYLWSDRIAPGASILIYASPSQVLVGAVVVAVGVVFVDLCRRTLAQAEWVWLALLVVTCSGSKPTAIPLLLAGSGLAWIVHSIRERRISARLLVAAAMLLVVFIASRFLVSGSPPGGLTILSTIRGLPIYRELTGDSSLAGVDQGLLVESMLTSQGFVTAGVLLAWLVASHAVRLVGLGLLIHPATRRDPAAWWLAGAALGGWAATLLVDHPSLGQLYFLITANAFGAVLTAWLLAVVTPSGQRGLRLVLTGSSAGAVLAWGARRSFTGGDRGELERIALPLLLAVVALVVGTSLVLLLRSRGLATRGVGLCLLMSALVGAAIPGAVEASARSLQAAVQSAPAVDTTSPWFVSAAEQEAALWLREHSSAEDVVATNLQCAPPPAEPGCDARAFWLSGLSGRRIVLEGWAYTPQSLAAHGEDGVYYARQPPPWPGRLTDSQEVFRDPSTGAIDRLRSRYGVRWLVGVRRAGPVPEALDSLAERVFDNGDVAIFRVPERAMGGASQ